MANYFALGQLIINRLVSRLGDTVVGVHALSGLDDLLEGRVESPAVYVLFDREIVPANAATANGKQQITHQAWMILLAIRNFGAEDMLAEAGQLIHEINRGLMGWCPPGFGPLQKRSSPSSQYDGIYNIFSLSYTSLVVVNGEQI